VSGRRPPIALSVDLAAFEELRARLAVLEYERRNTLVRIVVIVDALADGDIEYAASLARDLERDLRGAA
jgi:hypothetical protein